MTETIFVTTTLASGLPGQDLGSFRTERIDIGHHMVLHYVDKNGKHFKIEAAPQERLKTTFKKAIELIKEEIITIGETNTDSGFGPIVVEPGEGEPEELLRDRETIARGSDLSGKWKGIVSSFMKINKNYEYRPYSQNSNTSVNHVLRANGLPPAKGVSDSGKKYKIIGADKDLKNPINTGLEKTSENKVQNPAPSFQSEKRQDRAFPSFELQDDASASLSTPFQDENKQTNLGSAPLPMKRIKLTAAKPISADGPVPEKGPERVKTDPNYNPFNVDENGFEDLEGEAFIWKTKPRLKDKMIVEAGRANFFGIDGEDF